MIDALLWPAAGVAGGVALFCGYLIWRKTRAVDAERERKDRADRLARTVLGDEGPTVLQFPAEAARRGRK